MVLSLMNKDKFLHVVKVSMESSPYFQLVSSSDAYRAVPPGASAPVRIRFTPSKNKDYCHELVCLTARERIVVPIRAIGARAVLDFPAQLDFSKCPVKVSTQQTLLVRNVGARAARYQLSTQSPFSVVPATGALGAGDTVQVTVAFHPLASGAHCGSLAVCCSSGEERIHTKLQGEAVDVNIGLSPNSVELDKTFTSMSSHRTLFIENRSNITAHFQWKAFATEEEENEAKRRQCLLRPPKEVSQENFPEEKETEKVKSFCGDHSALLSSMDKEKMVKVQEDPMLFSDDIFFLEPMVKLMNQGAIDAPFTCLPSATNLGLCFKFAPEEGIIAAGGSQSVQISFSATVLGSFEEEFQFSVAGSPTPAILTIKGSVTAPSLHFDLAELDFGDISFGFPYTQRCRLTNSSAVPLTFQLRMSDDGTQPAVDSVDQIRRDTDPAWSKGIHFHVEPREFTINPSGGTILPQGHRDIEVTLCSNTVMEFYRRLLVDLEGIGKGVASLIITARCLVPELQVSSPVVLCDECHLKALGTHRTNVLIGVFGDERNPLSFNILPLPGVLQPGESQQVTSTFSGHLNTTCNVPELCHMEGGSTSEVLVPRAASRQTPESAAGHGAGPVSCLPLLSGLGDAAEVGSRASPPLQAETVPESAAENGAEPAGLSEQPAADPTISVIPSSAGSSVARVTAAFQASPSVIHSPKSHLGEAHKGPGA
ncbi:hydrocephalus-inducing protein-like [Ammospiza caudacuta]|uniref:hydrocephalus-inducing protein-like n=1 Tax=Ammospiza caudacuta TaxID=2857398 RepID=UPI002739CEAE|nr:hydrocephalus-inducing protein-like [Ammospiza caudacuta]XP_058667676.1 hydrocephalus-inducing protein-like [Ammospiza caudacuta]XP_058667701.1 hydrocephalus-inducing protein-like [Ammospiza caudacuta]